MEKSAVSEDEKNPDSTSSTARKINCMIILKLSYTPAAEDSGK
jgi:hypothetical protein